MAKKFFTSESLSTFVDKIKAYVDNAVSKKSNIGHTHSIANVTNLQSTLDGKASTSHGTHVSYSTTIPAMDGTASVGSASAVARSDHKHPSDTSRVSKTDFDTHTSDTSKHITNTERANWNIAYNHSQSTHAPSNAEPNQNAFSNIKIGDVTIAADIKTDTFTLVAGDNVTLTPDTTNDKITISAKDTTYSLGSFGITATASELNKLDGVTATATEINYVDGVTSNIQTQIDGKAAKSHTHTVSNITDLTATAKELNYMDGVTSNVQTQLDGKSSSSHSHETHSQKSMSNTDLNTIKTAGWYYGYTGMTNAPAQSISVMEVLVYSQDWIVQRFIVVNGAEYIRHWHSATTWSDWKTNVDSGNIGSQSVNYAASAGSATKATKDASGNTITSTYATKSELDTAKSTLQTSINGKANTSHTHTITNITNLQTTLDGKAASSHNHAASNITSGTLSSDRLPTVPIAKGGTGSTTAAGALTNLGITATATELNYVDGVTSNIQTQLNGKSETSHTHSYLPLSGGTITGQLDADKIFRNGNTFYNVLEYASTATVDEIVIKTKIPFISGNSMPLVHLKGYAYGESATIEMTVAFYIYNDKFTNMGVVSSCPWKPTVYLSSYTENSTKYVAISFAGSIYYPRFVVDYTDIWSGSSNRDYSSGWTSSNRASGGTTSVIPTTDKVEILYKPIANNITGNASTATNVAWSGVTSKPSYYDAKAIKSITRSGTTFTYTCMDGTTGTFTQQDNNTTYSVATTSANGLMSSSDKTKLNAMELATLAEVKTYLGI